MTDTETIFVVLGVLYLWQCTVWLSPWARAFDMERDGGIRPLPAEGVFGNDSGGVVLAGLLPWSATIVTSMSPVSISPDGVLGFAASAPHRRRRAVQSEVFVPTSQCDSISLDDAVAKFAGERLAKFPDRRTAQSFVGLAKRLVESPDECTSTIDGAIRSTLDVSTLREKLQKFRTETWHLASASTVFFIVVFLFGPALYFTQRDRPDGLRWLLPYFGGVLICWLWTIVEFFLSHRAVHPEARWERVGSALEMLILPVAAMRARDRISRRLALSFHPLAAMLAAPVEKRPEHYIRRVMADLRHPMLPLYEGPSTDAAEVERWHRERLLAAAESVAAAEGVDPESIGSPPERIDPQAHSYCPRCDLEYLPGVAKCEDCGGIELRKL